MKANRTLTALSLAIALHLGFFFFVWMAVHPLKEEVTPVREKRFGVVVGEEPSLSEEIDPQAPPEDVSPRKAEVPHKHPRTPEPQTPPSPVPTDVAVPSDLPAPITPDQRDTLPRSVLHHYGEHFFDLSAGEQHYIIDNLQRIRKINEVVGTRLLRERYDVEIDPQDSNVVEFTLHPDGTISDLHLQKNRVGTFLDELTLQTITLAHSRYPKPEQPTRIRIRVYIVVR